MNRLKNIFMIQRDSNKRVGKWSYLKKKTDLGKSLSSDTESVNEAHKICSRDRGADCLKAR